MQANTLIKALRDSAGRFSGRESIAATQLPRERIWTQTNELAFIYKTLPLYASGLSEFTQQGTAAEFHRKRSAPLKDLTQGYLTGIKQRKYWDFVNGSNPQQLIQCAEHALEHPPAFVGYMRDHAQELVDRFGVKPVVIHNECVPGYRGWVEHITHSVFSGEKILPEFIFAGSDISELLTYICKKRHGTTQLGEAL